MAVAIVHLHSPVKSLVSRRAPHISSDSTLTHASQVMRSENTSALLVGPGHAAIVTERDLTRAMAWELPPETPVAKVATPLPLSLPADTDLVAAAAIMLNREVRHIVVELPEGDAIVSSRQVLAVLLQAAQPEIWLARLRAHVEMPEVWLG